ncbi:MAG: tetratricopeptide repeat protein, partial [Acidobacteria bacterium]|nr:tetratricopeptide repeat protein [Acidobacteriota bacterium]
MRPRTAVVSLLVGLMLAVAGVAAADYQAGQKAYARGDFATAAKELAPVVEGHANDARYAGAFYMLGMSQSRLGQNKDALSNLECAVKLDASQGVYSLGLGQALLNARQDERAYTVLKGIDGAALKPKQRTPLALLLATAALRSNHGGAAVETLEARLAASPGEAVVQRALGATFHYLGRNAEAFEAYAAAFNAKPTDLESGRMAVKIGLAQAAGTTDKAVRARLYRRTADVAEGLAGSSPGPKTAVLAGEANLGAGDYTAALGWFEKADKASPGDPMVLASLAQALGHLGRLDEALAADGRALASSPDAELRSRIFNHLGDVHACRLELDKAADAYEKAGNAKRAAEMRKLAEDVRQTRAQREQFENQVAKLQQTAAQLDALGEREGAAKLRQRIEVLKSEIAGIDSNLASVKKALQIDYPGPTPHPAAAKRPQD